MVQFASVLKYHGTKFEAVVGWEDNLSVLLGRWNYGKRIDWSGGGLDDSRKYGSFRPHSYWLLSFENFELLVCENKKNLRKMFQDRLKLLP